MSPFSSPFTLVLLPPPWRGGLGRGLLQCPLNFVHHIPYVFIERLIAKPNDTESARSEPNGSACVVNLALLPGVLRPIKLDDQAVREANKVDHVRADGGLSAEFHAQFAGSQKMPQTLFCRRGVVAQLAGEVALLLVAVHENPPPQPSPQGGGSRKGLTIGSPQKGARMDV